MAPLLDKHMPVEKKDRRRVFFILFLFLLLGGGGFLIWKNSGGNDHNISQAKPNSENSTQNNSSTNSPLEKEKSINTPGNNSTETSSSQENDQATSKDFVKIPNPNNAGPLAGHEIKIDASGKIINTKLQNGPGTKKKTIEKDKPVNQTNDALIKNEKPDKPSIDKSSNTR
jgi:cytoskeletal protein RodZ